MIAKNGKYELFYVFSQALEQQANLLMLITVNGLMLMSHKPAKEYSSVQISTVVCDFKTLNWFNMLWSLWWPGAGGGDVLF